MTGASKLFYNWRSRSGRNPEPDLGLENSFPLGRDPDLRRPRQHHDHGLRRHRHRPGEEFDPSSRSNPRQLCLRASQKEPESVALDRSRTSDFGTGSSNAGGAAISTVSRLRLIRDHPLPDGVLQARARLLKRLQNVSLMGSRQTTTVSGIFGDEFAVSGDFAVDFREWHAEAPIHRFDSDIPYVEFTVQTDQTSSFHDENKKPLPGLSWGAFCSLQHEVFINSEDKGETSRSRECCICLESFMEGDELVLLHCGHRFHPLCLEPWVQACGDCPYCRANIIC